MDRLNKWQERPQEIAYLLNPAFCGRLLYATIEKYCKARVSGFPFPLVYLVLPLVLHAETRKAINSRTYLTVWAQKNRVLLLDFPNRCRDFVEITNEALEYMLQADYLALTDEGTLKSYKMLSASNKNLCDDDEVKECLRKAQHIARWFSQVGKTENVYVTLGVLP